MSTTDFFVSKAILNGRTVYLRVQWKQNDQDTDAFQLQILDEDCSWLGTFSNKLAQDNCSVLHQNMDEYIANTQQCLKGECGSEYEQEIAVSDDGETATFCWKKKHNGFSQKQGSMQLRKDATGSKTSLIDALINKNRDLSSIISELNQNIKVMSSHLDKHKTDLETFVDLKSSLESDLYGKFVELLNSKKKRIRLLEEQLKNYVD